MIRALAVVLLVAACGPRSVDEVCGEVQFATTGPSTPDPSAGFLVYAHAHNDYEHPRPLHDALDQRFGSVEADVFFTGGRFEVSHNGFSSKGTLQSLYLDPLQARVTANASVYGDGLPFSLWIDFKDDHPDLVSSLDALLQQYPMLTRNDADGVDPDAVSVVLTGNAAAKERFASSNTVRRAFRDSNAFDPDDPPADPFWRYYALDWNKYVGWNGDGALPTDAARRLECIHGIAHAKGRKVRLYNAPDKPSAWSAVLDYGGDFVGTDKLTELAQHLATRQ